MKVVVAGGTGFIGRPLCRALAARRETVLVLTREAHGQRGDVPVQYLGWQPGELGDWVGDLAGADAVVNLAGESMAGLRWTATKRQRIRQSRIDATWALVEALGRLGKQRPRILVNASAVGYYGDHGDEILDERSEPGADFLAHVCLDWEREAERAAAAGVRVVRLRTGMVLDNSGGALAAMLPAFRAGLGATLGSGRQWVSWIHRSDLVRLILHSIDHPEAEGAVNATAPEPVPNAELTRTLAEVLGRKARLQVPRFALRAGLGQMSALLLNSARVLPTRARQLGFNYNYPGLRAALHDIVAAGA